jgi:hypothetical protein
MRDETTKTPIDPQAKVSDFLQDRYRSHDRKIRKIGQPKRVEAYLARRAQRATKAPVENNYNHRTPEDFRSSYDQRS